jgi:hypothetical protein
LGGFPYHLGVGVRPVIRQFSAWLEERRSGTI